MISRKEHSNSLLLLAIIIEIDFIKNAVFN